MSDNETRTNWEAQSVRDENRKVASDGPWIGLGHRIPIDGRSAVEALESVGMDWDVEKRELSYPIVTGMNADGSPHYELEKVPNHVGVIRKDTDQCLGVVGSRVHQTLQNREHAAFADYMAKDAPVNFIGPWKDGRGLLIQSKLGDPLEHGTDMVQPYILSGQTHDGSSALFVAMIVHRFSCDNMLNMVLKSATARWSIRHTRTMDERMSQAAQVLRKAELYFAEYQEHALELMSQSFSGAQFAQLLDRIVPMPEAKMKDGKMEAPSARSVTVAERRREEILSLYHSDMVGDHIRGTRYGALQALSTDELWSRQSRGRNHLTAQMERVADGRSATYLARCERTLASIG